MEKDSAQTVHVVANVCVIQAHGILIAMVSPSMRSGDCVPSWIDFHEHTHFCGLLF